MNYRKAEAADAPALADFGARSFIDSYAHVMERAELEQYVSYHYTTRRIEREILDPHSATFLALDPEIVGFAQVRSDNRPDCELVAQAPAELRRIYVDRSRHGHGVGQALIALVEEEAQGRGRDVVWLAVWEINDRAISFYRKCGFEVVGRQGFPIGNEVQSDFVMARAVGR